MPKKKLDKKMSHLSSSIFVLFVLIQISFGQYEESYNCLNGDEAKFRMLLISPQENFLYNELIEKVTSRQNLESRLKVKARLTTVTGSIKGSNTCMTVIETGQSFSHEDVIDNIEEISQRCFSRILIAINVSENTSPLTNRETEMLVASLQILQSIYVQNIWEKIIVAFFSSASRTPNFYEDWFSTHITIRIRGGPTTNSIEILTLKNSDESSLLNSLKMFDGSTTFHKNEKTFLTKDGIPWIGIQSSETVDCFLFDDEVDKNRFSLMKDGEVMSQNQSSTFLKLRNDLFKVSTNLSDQQQGSFQCQYKNHISINSVKIEQPDSYQWSPWSKCFNISEKTTRTREKFQPSIEVETESRVCYCSDLEILPNPRILLIGKTGVGKSSIGNQLLGGYKAFAAGHTSESKTEEISIFTGNFLGTGECFTIIDTPGTKDTKGRDYKHTMMMQKLLKNTIKSFDVILLLTNGADTRVDSSTVEQMRWYEAVFGHDMWKHVIIEVTFWSHTKADRINRLKKRMVNETIYANGIRSKLKSELKIGDEVPLPVVFIDPMVDIFGDPCLPDYLEVEEDEKKSFNFYIKSLKEDLRKMPTFDCTERCQAPDEFFSGAPFVSNPIERKMNLKLGESRNIEWQIWVGETNDRSSAYKIYLNDNIIYQKSDGIIEKINSTGVEQLISQGFTFGLEESFKVPMVTTVRLTIHLNDSFSGKNLSFTSDIRNGVDSTLSSVEILVAKDAQVGPWSNWSGCSVTCLQEGTLIKGMQTRRRTCQPEETNGQSCAMLLGMSNIPPRSPGIQNETRTCSGGIDDSIVICPVQPSWGNWGEWESCPVSCGQGTQRRSRICNDGRHGGRRCVQRNDVDARTCNTNRICPVNCILGSWSDWSSCSLTCNRPNSDFSKRQRTKPILQEGNSEGTLCDRLVAKESTACDVQYCPVKISISVFDATTNYRLDNAFVKMELTSGYLSVTEGFTDGSGNLMVGMLNPGQVLKVSAVKNRYNKAEKHFYIEASASSEQTLALGMSPNFRNNEYRIVMTWYTEPKDLDLHVLQVNRFTGDLSCHIYYGNKNCPGLNLDVDNTGGGDNGAETVSITDPGSYIYAIYVFDYSNNGKYPLTRSGASIDIYKGSQSSRKVTVPYYSSTSGRHWIVGCLDGLDWKPFQSKNEIAYDSSDGTIARDCKMYF